LEATLQEIFVYGTTSTKRGRGAGFTEPIKTEQISDISVLRLDGTTMTVSMEILHELSGEVLLPSKAARKRFPREIGSYLQILKVKKSI